MCGRYALAASSHDLAEEFGVGVPSFTFEGSYNIAPGRDVPVLARDRKGTRLGLLRWGLLPPWARDDGPGFANARAETVAAKPSFRDAFARRRCLVPADGFYEWRDRVPHWIHPEESGRWTFAGIWSSWRAGSKDAVHAMAILTTESIGQLREVHERMPVIVGGRDREVWLDAGSAADRLEALLRAPPPGHFEIDRVSDAVNRTSSDGPELLQPLRA